MATMNFSIPEDVKDKFNEVFKDDNKSAVITELMRKAIEEKGLFERRKAAIALVEELRKDAPSITQDEIRAMREELRR